MVRSMPVTAVTSPKRFSTCSRRTSDMGRSLEQSRADGAAALLVEQGQPAGGEAQADIFAGAHRAGRLCPRLELPERRVDGHDLRRAQILAAIDRPAQGRVVIEVDVLRPHAQSE